MCIHQFLIIFSSILNVGNPDTQDHKIYLSRVMVPTGACREIHQPLESLWRPAFCGRARSTSRTCDHSLSIKGLLPCPEPPHVHERSLRSAAARVEDVAHLIEWDADTLQHFATEAEHEMLQEHLNCIVSMFSGEPYDPQYLHFR